MVDGVPYYQVLTGKGDTSKTVMLGPDDVKHLVAIYDEAITSADQQIGDLVAELKALGVYNKTIIIVTSEHGDMFGKYGRFMRGGPLQGTFYDDVLHIPLVIEGPNLPAKKIGGLAQQIDILPTLLNLIGLRPTFPIEGKSLLPLINSNTPVNDYVYAGSNFGPRIGNVTFDKSKAESIRSLEWKLIKEKSKTGTHVELYNIKNDPQELQDLSTTDTAELGQLEQLLSIWSKSVGGSNK